jgi:hypothetical protein
MAAILSPLGLYGGNRKYKIPLLANYEYMPLKANSEIFVIAPSDGCPVTTNLLSVDARLAILTRVLCLKSLDCVVAHLSDRCSSPVRPTSQT